MDSTIETYSSDSKTQFRFSIEAFKFIGMYDQVKTASCGETGASDCSKRLRGLLFVRCIGEKHSVALAVYSPKAKL